MKILLTIVVFNRYDNLKRWLECWEQCDQTDTELIIIHTGDEIEKFKSLCKDVTYIHRQNIGLDIGCFQDVCRERLTGFTNDWDYLLWITDDTFPMRKDFVKSFVDKLKPGVGISCMKISGEYSHHVRTTGFCIRKETSLKLTFPADPITTKQQCYLFEHRGGVNTLTNQIRRMGLSCVQVDKHKDSPLWDTGFNARRRLNRQDEHDKVFGFYKEKVITFIATIFHGYPQIVSSLLTQTNPNWKLLLIHDGPNGEIEVPKDKRIQYIETEKVSGNWGHANRAKYLQEVETDFVTISNNDNYYAPVFVDYMLKEFHQDTVGVYCSHMVHSYKAWNVIACSLNRGFIDCGGLVVRTKAAQDVGWNDTKTHSADWVWIEGMIKKYGEDKFIKKEGCIFVHN